MLDQRFVIIGVVLMLIGDLSYFINTLNGKVKPNKVSWLLWSLIPFVVFIAEIKQGVGLQSLMTLSVGVGTLAIFIASFFNKNAQWKLGALDVICGLLSFCGLILWYTTKVGNYAILFSIFADILAAAPTLVKAYKFPETEKYPAYLLTGVNGGITLLTVRSWNFATYGFPLYSILLNTVFFILIKFKIGKNKVLSIFH